MIVDDFHTQLMIMQMYLPITFKRKKITLIYNIIV